MTAFKKKPERATRTIEDITAREEAFIAGAKAEEPPTASVKPPAKKKLPVKGAKPEALKPVDPYPLIHRTNWPITFTPQAPILAEGRDDIDKPFVMRLKENFWNSVEIHCQALGIPKSEWVRKAMERQLYEEQQYFLDK